MVAAVSSEAGGLSSYTTIFAKEYRRPLFFCALVTIAPILYGYDGTYFTSLLETQVFIDQFGDYDSEKGGYALSTSDTSLWVSIIQVGEVVGSLAAGPIG